ncbi:hypothetical protein AJ88_07355 [Mesorhizobium amorphae CCBAU 01583]|nr:hypothetical protein AJ88_07355 [Mesorhizobium amorphae CCBAU 01583]
MKAIGALGRHGFYDAVDFTPQRVPEGSDHAVVLNYMAHHSGMSIAAVADAIFEGRLRDRFHSDPVIESAELLLQERAPRDIPTATVRTEADERSKDETETESPDTRIILEPARALRSTNVMSNGRYSVMVTATGSGYSRFGELAVTRWQPDPTEDRLGSYVFLRDAGTGDWWSATSEQGGRRTSASRRCFPTTRRASSNPWDRCVRRSNASSSRKAMAKAAASRSTMTAPSTGISR